MSKKPTAEILVTIRRKNNLSQEEAAKRLGMARSTLSGYELGYRNPKYQTLKKFADFYKVSVDYLLDGEDKDYKKVKETFLDALDDYHSPVTEDHLTPGTQILLQTLKGASEDEILQAVKIIEALRK